MDGRSHSITAAFLSGLLFSAAVSAQESKAPPGQAGALDGIAPTAAQPPANAAVQPKAEPKKSNILDLDLERLSDVPARVPAGFDTRVTSVGRELDVGTGAAQPSATIGRSPAAIYVITAEDIRRSGHRSIPELLRMAPGLEVARVTSNIWAISARGFNNRFANKLLVLIDGRTVYSPAFAGVYWDDRDVMIDDVERIEVIRGPGATMWGANAVNGVINIITKKAQDTQGGLIVGGGGNYERGFGSFRYGGKLGDNAWYRIYANYFNRDGGVDNLGLPGADPWNVGRLGMRVDWTPTCNDSFLFQGDLYSGIEELGNFPLAVLPPSPNLFNDRFSIGGGYFLSRWTHVYSDTANSSLQFYYDHYERAEHIVSEIRDTFDLDFSHRFALTPRQRITCGAGYRYSADEFQSGPSASFVPNHRGINLPSCFLQDDIELVKDRLHFIAGSRFEHNDFTGFQVQPAARILWTPDERHTVWGAVSRAVRTPSRADDDIVFNVQSFPGGTLFPGAPPALARLYGSRGSLSEELIAYEAGYRVSPTPNLGIDVAGFYNDYDRLQSTAQRSPFLEPFPSPLHLVLPSVFTNTMQGETYGVEVACDWKVTPCWQLRAGYTWLQMQLHDPSNRGSESAEGNSPHNQFNVRSYLTLPRNLELDAGFYYVDNLPNGDVPRYLRLDVRLGWRPRNNLELVLGLQNLLDPRHPEFGPINGLEVPTQVQRSVYGMVRWKF